MKVGIVGTGIAGLSAALSALENGDRVTIFTKADSLEHSSSSWAQGGIVGQGMNDSERKLYRDMAKASGGMLMPEVTKLFCEEAPLVAKEILINKVKVPFTKNEKEEFELTREAGHSKKRILYYQDVTGKTIIDFFLKYLKKKKIKFLKSRMIIDLINIPHHSKDPLAVYEKTKCIGLYVYDIQRKKVNQIFFDKIILATGGIGKIYKHSTNPSTATGDGIALAYRAGVRIINMEFTQFHPTTLAVKKANNFLISEALRGEKAILINHLGEEFMENYDPRGSLAPRDIVSRTIYLEQLKNKDYPIYLSLRKMKNSFAKRFPNIYKKCRELHINFQEQGIPITPAFHFSCGGILTDENGQTNIKNLFAVGENACTGIHGANRLASTSLLEGVYFGYRAGQVKLNQTHSYSRKKIKPWIISPEMVEPDLFFIRHNFEYLQNLMWNYVGIIRKKKNLKLALDELAELKKKIEAKYHNGYLSKRFLELRNSVQVAMIVANSAIKNPISRGCHYIEN